MLRIKLNEDTDSHIRQNRTLQVRQDFATAYGHHNISKSNICAHLPSALALAAYAGRVSSIAAKQFVSGEAAQAAVAPLPHLILRPP
jgi:hypothetical protein